MTGSVHLDDLAEPRFPADAQAVLDMMAGMADTCPLEPAALMEAAVAQTGGLSDFGDPAFHDNLDLLCRSLRQEAGLGPHGRTATHVRFVQLLKNRLLVEDLLQRHPEIRDIPITAPIIIAGMPRTGTTHLQNLIAADPAIRSLPYWEAVEPVPPPGEEGIEPRIARAAAALDFVHTAMPYFRRMFDLAPTNSHEEIDLLAMTFASVSFETQALIPSYRDWYTSADLTPAYAYLRTVLQVLTWLRPGPGRWVLKSPQHLEQFGPMMRVFPDAVVVVTHRDPVAITASMTTMICYALRLSTAPIDPHKVGRYWASRTEDLLTGCLRDRHLAPAGRSIDVLFHEFMADEAAMVRRVYAAAGQPFTAETWAAMDAYLAEHRRGRHGTVDYRLGDLGLDPAERRSALAHYTAHFGVREETMR
ncbi:sulfotransferase family protein [Nonomuraea dietziae]|uniref:sulfotransferase family protein n=1 Tax=Nonomuraea dietziae TaxID=65515 RepID=UPI0034015042